MFFKLLWSFGTIWHGQKKCSTIFCWISFLASVFSISNWKVGQEEGKCERKPEERVERKKNCRKTLDFFEVFLWNIYVLEENGDLFEWKVGRESESKWEQKKASAIIYGWWGWDEAAGSAGGGLRKAEPVKVRKKDWEKSTELEIELFYMKQKFDFPLEIFAYWIFFSLKLITKLSHLFHSSNFGTGDRLRVGKVSKMRNFVHLRSNTCCFEERGSTERNKLKFSNEFNFEAELSPIFAQHRLFHLRLLILAYFDVPLLAQKTKMKIENDFLHFFIPRDFYCVKRWIEKQQRKEIFREWENVVSHTNSTHIESSRVAMEHDGMKWRNLKRVWEFPWTFPQIEKSFSSSLICEMVEWQYPDKVDVWRVKTAKWGRLFVVYCYEEWMNLSSFQISRI